MDIEGVICTPLTKIPDERGTVMHFIRDYEWDKKFGEVYVTTVRYGIVKAWHGYREKSLCYTVIKGMVKLVLYDNRKDSATFGETDEFYLGDDNYYRIQIPPGVFNGFKGISKEDAIVVVLADRHFREDEIIRLPYNDQNIDYDWGVRNK